MLQPLAKNEPDLIQELSLIRLSLNLVLSDQLFEQSYFFPADAAGHQVREQLSQIMVIQFCTFVTLETNRSNQGKKRSRKSGLLGQLCCSVVHSNFI